MILVNADDFGRSESINSSILYAFENKIINRTTMMINMPFVREAVKCANEKNITDRIGLHLTLDEGRPITDNIKNIRLFCDTDGSFNGNFRKSKKYFLSLNDSVVKKSCEEEISAQMQYYRTLGMSLFHIDSHHHVHTIPSILKITAPLAIDYGFKSMRIRFNMRKTNLVKSVYTRCVNAFISKKFETTDYFCDSEFLSKKPNGIAEYEIMCHPDIIDGRYVDIIGERSAGVFYDLSHIEFLLK